MSPFPQKDPADWGRGIKSSANDPITRQMIADSENGYIEGTAEQIAAQHKAAALKVFPPEDRYPVLSNVMTTDSMKAGGTPFFCPACKSACTALVPNPHAPQDVSSARCTSCAGTSDIVSAAPQPGDAPLSTKRPKAQRTLALDEG
jgi:hypothetical protein